MYEETPYTPAPRAIKWFKLYALSLSAVYALLIVLAFPLLMMDAAALDMDPLEAKITGVLFLAMGVPLLASFLAPLFLGRKPWVWTYSLILIALGLSSCCLPLCVFLLMEWLKPETKRYYGMP